MGVFAQGGMGTDYSSTSFLTAGSGEAVRSEVSVGRLVLPVAYDLNENFKIAGSVDFVWAGMDLKMALSGAQFGDFVADLGGTQAGGTASGTMVDGLVGMIMAGATDPTGPINWTRFDFSNDSDFTGEAKGSGFAGKLGIVYTVGSNLTIGATYHSKTSMGDLETSNATISMDANLDNNMLAGTWDPFGTAGTPAGTYSAVTIPVTGKITVLDFQWPAIIGYGVSYKVNEELVVGLDVKNIGWSAVMEDFSMSFTADAAQDNPLAAGFAGASLDATFFQKWEDQTVISIGAEYKMGDAVSLRAGFNTASNPVPNAYLNPLFPAIVESHLTFGVGYELSDASSVNISVVSAPEVTATSGAGVISSHGQTNFQLQYSHSF